MKPASLADIKKELKQKPPEKLMDICLRLGRFKKDNKELLTYLLFDEDDEAGYIEQIKYDIDDQMEVIDSNHIYYAKKGIQKILRNLNKQIRYSGSKQTELEVRLYFCQAIKKSGISIGKSTVLTNMYERQVLKINNILALLHEEIQSDYSKDVSVL